MSHANSEKLNSKALQMFFFKDNHPLKVFYWLVVFLLTGCATPAEFNIDVDSLAITDAKHNNKYILMPGNDNCAPSNLQFVEFATHTDRALQSVGFIKADPPDDADVAIYLKYGIKPYYYEYNYSVPIFGQTGVASSSSSGCVNTFGNMATYSNNTTYTPSYGIIGATTHTATDVCFARYLCLTAFDITKLKTTNNVKDATQIWSTKVISAGQSGDLRLVFPIMLVVSKDYFATSTGKTLTFQIPVSDERICKILHPVGSGGKGSS